MRRLAQALLTLALAAPLFAVACSKPSAPDPTPAASDDDDDKAKPKKKKKPKKDDDDDSTGGDGSDAGAAPTTTTTTVGTWKPGMPTATAPTASTTGTATDPGKTKLMACCTALRNAASAAAAAKTASSAVLPGMPAAPPPQIDPAELDKAVKACDAQVATWNGDLSGAMSKVKNASKVTLPSACAI